MVYLENKTELQELWIPRNDGQGVPYNPTKELEGVDVTISEDITVVHPSSGYYGMSAVTIDASEYGQSNYDEGFDDGYTDGYSSGTSDGEQSIIDTFTSTTITINGQYGSSANPYSSVTVNVAQTGHTDEELQEAYESGYTSGSTDGYNSGYTSGETHQKSLLVSTAFTENGTYTRENGYSAITVNVPQTGSTNSIISVTGDTWYVLDHYFGTGEQIEITNATFDYSIANDARHQQLIAGGAGEWVRIGGNGDNLYTSYYGTNKIDVGPIILDDDHILLTNGAFYINDMETPVSTFGPYPLDIFKDKRMVVFANTAIGQDSVCGQTASVGVITIYDENDNVVDKYIPELHDGVVCLHNVISGNYITPSGTGTPTITNTDYSEGYMDGRQDVISTFTAATATTNGVYGSSANPYSSITVNVPQTGHTDQELQDAYNSGYTSGSTDVISTFSSTTATTNGVYGSSAHPLSSITVNVPQTGSSKVISLVDYVHTDILSDDANDKYLDTGIIPTTATTFRVQGMTKGYGQGNAIVGYTYNDSEDYRLFWWNWYSTGSHLTFDFNNQRIDNRWGGSYDGRIVDITCSNYQAVSGDGTTLMSGTTQTTIDDPHTILIDVGSWWAKSLEIWDNGVKVFDGQAAIDSDGNVGLYDTVSMSMVYNSALTMDYEGTPTPIPSQDYQSGYTDGQNSIISTFTSTAVTTNGIYGSSANPYSSITVNVPPSNYSLNDLAERNYSTYVDPEISVRIIVPYAFYNKDLIGHLTLVTNSDEGYVGQYSFFNTNITGITWPNYLYYVSDGSFGGTKLQGNLVISGNVFFIIGSGSGPFLGCTGLTSLLFEEKLPRLLTYSKVIPERCFENCFNLSSITFNNNSVNEIKNNAFMNCTGLTEINVSQITPPTISSNTFYHISQTGTVHYPAGSDYSSWQNNQYLSGWTFVADL